SHTVRRRTAPSTGPLPRFPRPRRMLPLDTLPWSDAMKIGMNLLLWTGFVTEADFPILGKLKAAGFDGVELPLFDGTADHYKKVRVALDKQGLACHTVTIMTPEANTISHALHVRAAAVERLKWAVEMNHVLGSSAMCGPFHSPLGVFSGTG